MRTTFIVSYDIADPKRLRKVVEPCKDFGEHIQFSVFECDLNPAEKIEFERQLAQIIHHAQDQVLFIDIGPSEGRGDRVISSLGIPYFKFDSPCYVV